jgi:DUF4097 and DUF4098 domain-containing protein YvlB
MTAGAALVGLLLTIWLVSGIVSTGSQTVEETFVVGSSPRLVVDTSVDGHVTVQSGAAGSVAVETRLRDERRIAYQTRQDGDTIRVESSAARLIPFQFLPSWWRAANVVVTAPAGTVIEIRTRNGDAVMDGLQSDATVHSTNGSIRLHDTHGNVTATSTNGSITFDGVVPAGVTTQLATTNGRLEVRLTDTQGTFDAKTTNGPVSFEGPLTGDGQARLQTTNGRVDVRLTGTPDVTVDLDTSNGSVTSTWPVVAETVDEDTLKGTIGDGRAGLTVRTSNGEIAIE